MLHLSRDGGETLTRQLTDQLRELITERTPRARPAPAVEPAARAIARCVAQHRLVCDRATGRGRLPRAFRPAAVRRWPRACRSTAASRHRQATAPTRRYLKLSSWARGLQRANWPPIHDGRPRPFQSGLADEREFPHDAMEPPSAARGAKRAVAPGPVHQPSAAAASAAAASGGSSRDQGKAGPDPDRADRAVRPRADRRRRCSIAAITPGSKAPAMAAPTSHCGPPALSSPPFRSTNKA